MGTGEALGVIGDTREDWGLPGGLLDYATLRTTAMWVKRWQPIRDAAKVWVASYRFILKLLIPFLMV